MFIKIPVLWLVEKTEEETLYSKVLSDVGVETENEVEKGFATINTEHIKAFNDSGKRNGVTSLWMVGDGPTCYYVDMAYQEFEDRLHKASGIMVENLG